MADQYKFDPTMTLSANRIFNEKHVITSTNFRNYHYVIPKFAPFFIESATIRLKLPSGTYREMVEGRDFYYSHQFLDASATTNHTLCGSISFLDTDTEGVLEINYHTVGGMWTLTPAQILEIMANNTRNPRVTSWEFVANPPERFPVIDHPHDIVDFKTMADVQRSVDGVRDAILASTGGGLGAHVNNFNNPHGVTKTQLGLGSVQNYGIATTQEAIDGTSGTKYMTPVRVAEAIAGRVANAVAQHANRIDNPHNTTKSHVGLSLVENYAIATRLEAIDGLVDDKYMTPLRVAEAISVQAGERITAHVDNRQNPHGVTKAQIGLFNVENYLVASAEEARDGDRNDRYMTPLRTMQLVQQYVFGALTSHTTDFSNPHQVTKAQVGLSNVVNYGIASDTDLVNMVNDKYVTPRGVSLMLRQNDAGLSNHLEDFQNPHRVTAAQIGVYSKNEVDLAVSGRLAYNETAVNSTLFAGRTPEQHLEYTFGSAQATQLGERIMKNVEDFAIAQYETDFGAGEWIRIHSIPYGTDALLEEENDGVALLCGGGRNANSTTLMIRTGYRQTTGVSMSVEVLGIAHPNPNIKFGMVRNTTDGTINSYVFLPAGTSPFRVVELGNQEYFGLENVGPTDPTGLVDITAVSIWIELAALSTAFVANNQAMVQSFANVTSSIEALNTRLVSVEQVHSGVKIV